jgi:hypothetical protein
VNRSFIALEMRRKSRDIPFPVPEQQVQDLQDRGQPIGLSDSTVGISPIGDVVVFFWHGAWVPLEIVSTDPLNWTPSMIDAAH